jgi:hypothetical protein
MRSDRLNVNSSDYNKEYPSNTVFKWNYIDCGYPIVTSLGNSGDGVMATEDKFGMIFPGPNGEWYPATAISVGAFTAAGKPPQVDGSVPATDTATTSAGLDLQMDCETAGADVGLEMVLGGGPLGGNHGFTIGTHTGYIDATFVTPDWTDFDCVAIGFRKVEDFNDGHVPILKTAAAGDGVYTDFAAFGALGDTNLETATDLNNSGTSVSTDLGSGALPVDTQNLRLRIHISSGGVVTYRFVVNAVAGAGTLAEPADVASYTFDDGDVVIPYIATLSDTAAADVLYLKDVTVKKYPSTSAYATQV